VDPPPGTGWAWGCIHSGQWLTILGAGHTTPILARTPGEAQLPNRWRPGRLVLALVRPTSTTTFRILETMHALCHQCRTYHTPVDIDADSGQCRTCASTVPKPATVQ